MNGLNVYLAALAVTCNAPTDVILLHAGISHLRGWERATVEQVTERIIADFKSGELDARFPEP